MTETVSVNEHWRELRKDDKEALQIALAAADRAVNKAEEAQLRVNQTQNEFRGTLKDQAALLMPRKEVEQLMDSQQKEIDSLKRLVYVGTGIIVALQFLIPFIIK